jgi:pilus assembly protein CpaE
MKIAVISPHSAHREEIGRFLQCDARLVALHQGGASKVPVVADQERPNLIILDSMCRDLEDLGVVEYVASQHPQTVMVMLCANQSPDFLINAMRAGVREVLQSPVSPEALLACVERIEQRRGIGSKPRQAGQILTFIPCKGGSGSTFLATNLGYQLAGQDKKVILIDLNLQFGDAVLFVHDHKPTTNLADVAQNIHRLDSSFLASSLVNVSPNFGVLPAPEDPGQAMGVKPEHIDVLLNVAVNAYDFVVLDVGRQLDAVTIRALDRSHYVFPVLQTTLPFVRDAARLLAAFCSLNYPREKIRLVVNRYEKGGEIGLDDVTRTLGIEPYTTVPNSYQAVAAAVNQGRPIASFARHNNVAKALQELAQALSPRQPVAAESAFLGKLLRRGSNK